MLNVTVIIPVWHPNPKRIENLQFVTNFWRGQKDVSVTLDVVRRDEMEFNKQWLINLGVRRCKTDGFIVADMDAYHKSATYLSNFLDWVKQHNYRWAFGYARFMYEGKGNKFERRDWPEPGIQEGGIVYFSKDLWQEMGGANEFIKTLRGPDNDIAMRARYITACHVGFPETIYHRWHPYSPYKNGNHVKYNKDILKYTRRNINKVIDMLKELPWGREEGSYAFEKSFYEARR